eukprot:Clim_evm18s4 gene=Clim_evmTU18s4
MPVEQLPQIATEEEMANAKIPLAFRDVCAHILIPLNECRIKNNYSMNACHHLKHDYEICRYKDFMYRVGKKRSDAREAARAAREAAAQE